MLLMKHKWSKWRVRVVEEITQRSLSSLESRNDPIEERPTEIITIVPKRPTSGGDRNKGKWLRLPYIKHAPKESVILLIVDMPVTMQMIGKMKPPRVGS